MAINYYTCNTLTNNKKNKMPKSIFISSSSLFRQFSYCFTLSILLLLSGFCHAASEHEMYVGAQKDQICDNATAEIVGQFLHNAAFKFQPDRHYSPDENAAIAAGACKINPIDKNITIAAFSYLGKEQSQQLIIAIIDNKKRKVISSYQGEIYEDAAMRVESGSLWIDTAPYMLAKNIRAFGLDVTSGYIAHCGDGGGGAGRTLYVQSGKVLKPVMQELPISYWRFIKEGSSRCNSSASDEESIIESIDISLGVSGTQTNGFNDLLVTAKSSRDDGKAVRKPFQYRLKYDGSTYSLKDFSNAFWKWFS
jgi:hypothetical protein